MDVNRPITIVPEKASALEDALSTANGRATRHTLRTYSELEEVATLAEQQLARILPFVKDRPGAEFTYRGEGAWANAYRHAMTVSHIRLRRVRAGWALLKAETANAYPKQKPKLQLLLNDPQATRAHALLEELFKRLPKAGSGPDAV
jgi:hypothetical protein